MVRSHNQPSGTAFWCEAAEERVRIMVAAVARMFVSPALEFLQPTPPIYLCVEPCLLVRE